jgi:phosphopantothenoylcysteine decarboxylase/phosphopantothenate--cysteine ligase
LEDNARKKMHAKNLDLIVANDITKGIFGSDSTSISVIDNQGIVSRYDKISKAEAAEIILDGILEKMPSGR